MGKDLLQEPTLAPALAFALAAPPDHECSEMSQSSPVPRTLPPLLAEALRKKGYDTLTAVQTAVADPKVTDRDLLVSSKTGSGKTVAYGLGLASALLTDPLPAHHAAAGDFANGAGRLPPASKPLALIIAPTRELALQVQRELDWLYQDAGAIIAACVGGMDARAERRQLDRGAHIIVGTPGRLVDHLSRGALDLDQLAAVVLDEADEMLDLGFREDLETILGRTPATRRTLLFSATLPKAIIALATRFQRNAVRIEVAGDVSGHADIEHRAAMVKPNGIEHGVVNLLRHTDTPAALVFCNTRDAVRHLHATLMERGFAAVILSGELGQHERNQALQALRDGRARVCIATDVAARGIDLPQCGLVIHADLPHDSEVLQHRSGRTGRAGRKGISVVLVPPSRRRKADRLFAEGGIRPAWVALPSADDIRLQDRERLLEDDSIVADLTDLDREMGAALLERRPAADIAAALARLFRIRLPEPEDIEAIAPGELRAAKSRRQDSETRPSEGRWFALNIGRKDNAEPKGLLRLLTRRGGVEKQDIGGIRIHDNTSEVEIAAAVADRFERKAAQAGPGDVRITAIEQPSAKPRRNFGNKPASGHKPNKDHKPNKQKNGHQAENSAGPVHTKKPRKTG